MANVSAKAFETLSPSARPHCNENKRICGILRETCVLEITSIIEFEAQWAWALASNSVINEFGFIRYVFMDWVNLSRLVNAKGVM